MAKQGLFINDRPIGEGAAFDFASIIGTMHEFISSTPTDAHLNICVSGRWGTGKSTLLKGLENAFSTASQDDPLAEEFVTIWFDPWKLNSEEEVRNSLARTVLKKIEDDADFLTRADIGIDRRNVLRMLTDRLLQVSPDDVSTFYKADSRLRDTFVETEDIFRKVADVYLRDPGYPRRLIIFVDDLDRCRPARVTEVLESIKLFFGLDGFIFIFALDRDQLERAVAADYGLSSDEARVYLEKIFQLTVPLPRKRPKELQDFLENNLEKIGVKLEHPGLARAIVEQYGRNLRNLKLFINWFSFKRLLIGEIGDVGEEALFRWLYLESALENSIDTAVSDGATDLVVALEFIAHGGFLHDSVQQAAYLKRLGGGNLNYLALLAYAIVSSQDDVELPPAVLDIRQARMVEALAEDGPLLATLKVAREGSRLLIDSNLDRIAFLAQRDESGEADPASAPPPTDKPTPGLEYGNPWTASEWNKLGDSLRTARRAPESFIAYLMSHLLEPESSSYRADLGRVYRLAGKNVGSHYLMRGAYEKYPNSAYVLVDFAYLYDLGIRDEPFANLVYRQALSRGSKSSSVPHYLALNLEKEGDLQNAYLACLDSVLKEPHSSMRRDRLVRLSREIGVRHGAELPPDKELAAELSEAMKEGRYPRRLSEEELATMEARLKEPDDPEVVAEQLSRPPL